MSWLAPVPSLWATVVVSAGLALTGAVFGDVGCYRTIVVPMLPGIRSVPQWWWAVVLAPLAVSIGLAGYLFTKPKRLPLAAFGATVALLGYEWTAAHLGWPGHLKSYAVEAPGEFWTSAAALWFLVVLSITSVGCAVRRFVRRNRVATPLR